MIIHVTCWNTANSILVFLDFHHDELSEMILLSDTFKVNYFFIWKGGFKTGKISKKEREQHYLNEEK